MDIWGKKKLTFTIGRQVVTLGHLPAYLQLTHLKNVSASFYLLNLLAKQEERVIELPVKPGTKKVYQQDLKTFIESATTSRANAFYLAYDNCVHKVWNLLQSGIPFYKRFFIKRVFFKQARRDVEWLLRFVNDVYDYWLVLGKQIGLIAALEVSKATTG